MVSGSAYSESANLRENTAAATDSLKLTTIPPSTSARLPVRVGAKRAVCTLIRSPNSRRALMKCPGVGHFSSSLCLLGINTGKASSTDSQVLYFVKLFGNLPGTPTLCKTVVDASLSVNSRGNVLLNAGRIDDR